jgi:hypothetical protein
MKYAVRLVMAGDHYGLDRKLTHQGLMPMVEFYDADYAGDARFDPEGQFVSRYNLDTLLDIRERLSAGGLDLQGDVPKWKLSGEQMREAFAELDRLLTVG